jgi:hypothetical protein
MTHKAITLKFVVPTAVALGIILSIGAVHLKDRHPVAIDRAEANAELPSLQLSRVHVLLFSM